MNLDISPKSVGGTANRKILRLSAIALFAAVLTARAFAGGNFCNPNSFVPAYVSCPDPTQRYYAICNCSSWNDTTGYSDCTVIDGCY